MLGEAAAFHDSDFSPDLINHHVHNIELFAVTFSFRRRYANTDRLILPTEDRGSGFSIADGSLLGTGKLSTRTAILSFSHNLWGHQLKDGPNSSQKPEIGSGLFNRGVYQRQSSLCRQRAVVIIHSFLRRGAFTSGRRKNSVATIIAFAYSDSFLSHLGALLIIIGVKPCAGEHGGHLGGVRASA